MCCLSIKGWLLNKDGTLVRIMFRAGNASKAEITVECLQSSGHEIWLSEPCVFGQVKPMKAILIMILGIGGLNGKI